MRLACRFQTRKPEARATFFAAKTAINVYKQARHPERSEEPRNVIQDLRDPSLSLRMTINEL